MLIRPTQGVYKSAGTKQLTQEILKISNKKIDFYNKIIFFLKYKII